MKKTMVALLAVIAMTAISGCAKDSAEKAANQIENRASDGDQLQRKGLQELNDAGEFINKIAKGEIPATVENVDLAIAKLKKSKSTLLASKSMYQESLNIHQKNKDRVDLYGKDSLYKAIEAIDETVSKIDKAIESLEAAKAQSK